MSDNVIEIFAEEKKPHPLRKQWIIFITIVVMIVVLLVWFLFTQTTALDGVKRFFRYFGVDEDAYGDLRFESYGNASYCVADDSFSVASQNGLKLFSESGNMRLKLSDSFYHPMLEACEDRVLLYDVGGSRVTLLNAGGEVLFDLTAEGKIFDADLSEEGSCAVLYEGEDCCAALDVFSSEGDVLFSHRSESAYLNACAISADADYVAVSTLGQEDISFLSTIRILSTNAEQVQETVSCGTQFICDLAFLEDDRICAIGEDVVFFVGLDGSVTEASESATIAGFCFGGGEMTVLYDHYDRNLGCELVSFDADGNRIASTKLNERPTRMSRCENYICLLTSQEVLVYDDSLSLRSKKPQQAYVAVLAREDGTALCVTSNSAELYIP